MAGPARELIVIEKDTPDRDALTKLCFQARIEVFVHEQGFPLETEIDESACSPLPKPYRLTHQVEWMKALLTF